MSEFNQLDNNEQDVQLDKFQIFEKWLKDNGAILPKLELKDYGNDVRGCHAKEDIYPEELILSIPLKLLITVEMGKETELGKLILLHNPVLDAPKHIFLMIYILLDRLNPNSFFKPYYDLLPPPPPHGLTNMPVFWEEEDLKRLEGSYLLNMIEERKKLIRKDYETICSISPSFSTQVSLNDFLWARMCVCSRNFGISITPTLNTAALVPYADMLNHYRPRMTRWQFDMSLNAFTIVSLENVSCGMQVYDSYGRKCNHRFLLNYGFSVENNVESDGLCPNDIPLFLSLKDDDPLKDLKLSYYSRDFFNPTIQLRVSVNDNEMFRYLLAYLRVIVSDEKDLEEISTLSYSLYSYSIRDTFFPINISNEKRMLTELLSMCKNLLSKYPTSYKHDVELLRRTRRRKSENDKEGESDYDMSLGANYDDVFDDDNDEEIENCFQNNSSSTSSLLSLNEENTKDNNNSEDNLSEEEKEKLKEREYNEYAPFTNARNALIQIKNEKEILHFYIKLCKISLKLLNKNFNSYDEFEYFFNKFLILSCNKKNKNRNNLIINYFSMSISKLLLDYMKEKENK